MPDLTPPTGVTPAVAQPPAPIPGPAGPTAPGVVPPKAAGMEARRPILVDEAMKLLAKALELGDVADDQGRAILDMLKAGTKVFGKPSGDLTRAELKSMNESAPQVSPTNPQAFQQAMRQQGAAQIRPPMASPVGAMA